MADDEGRSPDDLFGSERTRQDGNVKEVRWPQDEAVRVALWGPSGSGKTTFLWALLVADNGTYSGSDWRISPNDAAAQALSMTAFSALALQNRLPNPDLSLVQPSAWMLSRDADLRRTPPRGVPDFLRGRRWREAGEETQIPTHIQDLPGRVFDFGDEQAKQFRANAIRQLAEADAFVYLHDPLLDLDTEAQKSVAHFHGMLDAIEAVRPPELTGRRLEQHVAVCITKFDHPAVFDPAWEQGFATMNPAPHISQENARAYFDWLCERHDYHRRTELLRKDLHTRFHQDRVRYYATSSLGYYREYDRPHNPRDMRMDSPSGQRGTPDGPVTEGPVKPVNVLEPFVDLVRAVRRNPPSHGGYEGGRA
ncbi:hypothetical protein ACFZAD_21070 [Streptomyces iakyrus]|uniref:hypothetical protein n=1 Tax=Streptomyces iakyrus TaxID=68219 RepID=UPI0036E1FDC4